MGVRGLSSFVYKHRDEFLISHKLQDELVVIDGDNLMYRLGNTCKKLSPAFGGDYARYAARADEFFDVLTACGITPIVLLDGGSDPSSRKLKTSFNRLAEKLDRAKRLEPTNQGRVSMLPLLAKTTLIEVLRRREISFAVCPDEADESLAALARQLNCAVFSDDTDFFAFGVRCVMLSSLSEEVETAPDGRGCLDCVLFQHTRFMERYGLKPSMMPLLGCLAGNDYVSPSTLEKFLRQLPRPYGERRGARSQLRITGLVHWLRRHQSPEDALEDVMSQIKREDRAHVHALLQRSLDGYRRPVSGLLRWLRLSPIVQHGAELGQGAAVCGASVDCESPAGLALDNLILGDAPIPEWLWESLRRGHVTSDVINIISGQPILQEPQVEDWSRPAAGLCVLPILQWLLGALRGRDATVTLYHRQSGGGRGVTRNVIQSNASAVEVRLEDISNMSEMKRRRILLDVLEVEDVDLEAVPEDIQLLTVAVCYWGRHGTSPITAAHVGALLASYLRQQVSLPSLCRPDPALTSGERKLDRRLAHQWAELQTILASVGNVNAVLNGPFPRASPAKLLGGPVLYNACCQLRRFGAAQAEHWFPASPLREWRRLMKLMCTLTGVFANVKDHRKSSVTPSGVTSPAKGASKRRETKEVEKKAGDAQKDDPVGRSGEEGSDGRSDSDGGDDGDAAIEDNMARCSSAHRRYSGIRTPELRNNPFSVLLDDGDGDGESSN